MIADNVETAPSAHLNFAKLYLQAAKLIIEDEGGRKLLAMPVFMLVFHAMELALKAYLREKGIESKTLRLKYAHSLGKLYKKAKELGLRLEAGTVQDVENIVSLLDSGNKNYAFRYFSSQSTTRPDILWAFSVTDAFLAVIALHVDIPTNPGPATKLDFIISKPRPRTHR